MYVKNAENARAWYLEVRAINAAWYENKTPDMTFFLFFILFFHSFLSSFSFDLGQPPSDIDRFTFETSNTEISRDEYIARTEMSFSLRNASTCRNFRGITNFAECHVRCISPVSRRRHDAKGFAWEDATGEGGEQEEMQKQEAEEEEAVREA